MAEHVLISEDEVPVAGGQKTTIRTFTLKGEEENERLTQSGALEDANAAWVYQCHVG